MAHLETCSVCRGKGYIRCSICEGSGKLRKQPTSLSNNVFRVGEDFDGCETCQGTAGSYAKYVMGPERS